MAEKKENLFEILNQIDVGNHIDKIKSGSMNLSYLSWVWGWQKMKEADPEATVEYTEYDELVSGQLTGRKVPYLLTQQGCLIQCTVTIKGHPETETLPVMDFRNKAMTNPDMMAINKTMKRCFVKALALQGLGLYIYAGEDLPNSETDQDAPKRSNQSQSNPNLDRKIAELAVKIEDYTKQFNLTAEREYSIEQMLIALELRAGIAKKGDPLLAPDQLKLTQVNSLLELLDKKMNELAKGVA